jgi:uncharacterized protein
MSAILTDTQVPRAAAPVSDKERLKLIDALRGVALLGILLMNIVGFAMPDYYSEPFKSDPANVNFWVLAVISVGFAGKMRALFGMLFGAGVLLFVSQKALTGRSATGLFYRRMFWLILFGLVHAHLILWRGDILYLYGLCGMVVYLCRKIKPIYLILGVPLVAVFDFTAGTMLYQDLRAKRLAYVEASALAAENKPLSAAQEDAVARWREVEKTMIPSREVARENTRKMKSDYSTVASHLRPIAWKWESTLLPRLIWDSLALMLLGLALYQWGFLSGKWSNRAYAKVVAIGYGIGLPLATYAFYHGYLHRPNLEAILRRMELVPIEWVGLIHPFQRIFLVMAHVAAIILLYKAKYAQTLFRRLEAVGQMALTNYVMQSVICTLFFFGYGLNYYGELEFYQAYFVVLAVWIVQLTASPIWLRFFLFGPLEWVWRSLTYWKLQPLLRGGSERHVVQSPGRKALPHTIATSPTSL